MIFLCLFTLFQDIIPKKFNLFLGVIIQVKEKIS
jgi:hypothetical protein